MIPFPKTESLFFPLQGGLDLLTPAIALPPGRAADAQNYEPETIGGYRRLDGYERFDGRSSPTATASYIVLPVTLVRPVLAGSLFALGVTVKGQTSGATGRLAAAVTGRIVLSRVTGTFAADEQLTIGSGVTLTGVGVTLGVAEVAKTPAEEADFRAATVDSLRSDIGKPPGSGPVRGVWVLNDVVYAFRDNDTGTAGLIYRSTATGWQPVSYGYELKFNNGTAPVNVGDTVGNAATSPSATGVVTAVALQKGTWGSTAQGSLFLEAITGTFANGSGIFVGATQKATAAAASSQIGRLPGGRLEAVNYNFTGSTATLRMYGCDGVNRAFEFDGNHYWPITTGMTADTPNHIAAHKNALFLSFKGSVQYSPPGQPFAWTVVLGANEIATGDDVTAMIPAGGDQRGSALAIYTNRRMHVLYGSSSADFALQTSVFDIGYTAYTCQPVGNNIFGMTARGIQALTATQAYGNFQFNSVSHLVQPLINRKRGTEIASVVLHAKNQYRLFYADGTGLIVGLSGDKISGILPLNYGKAVRTICTATFANGAERTFFGSDDGYVYEDNVGTSFDGLPIEAYLRLPFNHAKSPRVRKRWRRGVLEVSASNYCQINVSYDLGYGDPNVAPHNVVPDLPLTGGGAYWDALVWDQFNWDAQPILSPSIALDGTEKNLSLIFYSNRSQDVSHTLQGVTILFTVRRIERS